MAALHGCLEEKQVAAFGRRHVCVLPARDNYAALLDEVETMPVSCRQRLMRPVDVEAG
jgi:hypothetical protein